MNKLIVIGAGGHGRVIADVARRQYEGIEILFLDDNLVGQVIDEALVDRFLNNIMLVWVCSTCKYGVFI